MSYNTSIPPSPSVEEKRKERTSENTNLELGFESHLELVLLFALPDKLLLVFFFRHLWFIHRGFRQCSELLVNSFKLCAKSTEMGYCCA